MHLPFIQLIANRKTNGIIRLVPILISSLSPSLEDCIASVLLDYFLDPGVLFIISSDFCHWGTRFRFTPSNDEMSISDFIHNMDRDGMCHIKNLDKKQFELYLLSTKNTICGRSPILLILNLCQRLSDVDRKKLSSSWSWLSYSQSEAVLSPAQSSVSYASSIAFI